MAQIENGHRAYIALFKLDHFEAELKTCGWGSAFQKEFVMLHCEGQAYSRDTKEY